MNTLTLADAARMMRESVKDKSYRGTPLGLEVAHFLRYFRFEFGATPESYRDYEAILAKLATYFADFEEWSFFEPPIGTTRVREFIAHYWEKPGDERAPATRKKVRAVLKSFFDWAGSEFKIHQNPVLGIRVPRRRDVEREAFDQNVSDRIIAAQTDLHDRVAVKLLLLAGLRKGSLQGIRIKDMDLGKRRIRVKAKGQKLRWMPIPSEELRKEMAELVRKHDPEDYLLCAEKPVPYWDKGQIAGLDKPNVRLVAYPKKPKGAHGLHNWWYRCLARAGIVAEGVTSGKKMHTARYTAGTNFYRETKDSKATQRLLGHEDYSTTMNIYVNPSEDSLAEWMAKVFDAADD